MPHSSGSSLSARSTDQPSTSGITMSSVIASGRSWRASRSPSAPPDGLDHAVAAAGELDLEQLARGAVVVDDQEHALPARRARRGALGRLGLAVAAGRTMVKVEPSPGRLSTDTSPPSMRQKCRVMASPRPVPP